jgi:hypothetical protein
MRQELAPRSEIEIDRLMRTVRPEYDGEPAIGEPPGPTDRAALNDVPARQGDEIRLRHGFAIPSLEMPAQTGPAAVVNLKNCPRGACLRNGFGCALL